MSSSPSIQDQLTLIEIKPGKQFPLGTLQSLLPDTETALFFAKAYKLDHVQVSNLLRVVFNTSLSRALFSEGSSHSNELQGYIVDLLDEGGVNYEAGELKTSNEPTHAEILPHVWESLEVEVAESIQAVVSKLDSTLDVLPGKQGHMLFKTLAVLNKKRPTIGDYRATIVRPRRPDNLVVFDVSGSMSEATVRTIVQDVVALGYKANAHLAIVSNSTFHWEPGTYNVDMVLQAAEFGGTRYETLVPLFENRHWGTVVSIADYDSSRSAAERLKECNGRIGELLDISLVNQPTYLAYCLGQLANKVRPMLIGSTHNVL